jgi:putative phage-type endonuclease
MHDPENIRKSAIGGSEVAALFDADPWKDAFTVWALKKGGLQPADPSPQMLTGKILEPAVLKIYTYITGRELVYCDVTKRHPERPWMAYTPDALCRDERRGVEAKVVGWDQRNAWGDGLDEIPLHAEFQVRHYMAAMEYEVWDVIALMPGPAPRIYEIHRDLDIEPLMLKREQEWWERYILGDDRPPMGGTEDAARWLQKTYPSHKRPDLREATPEEVDLLSEYVQLRVEQGELMERRGYLECQLKDAIKEREGLIWPEGQFTWRSTKDSKHVDWQAMAMGLAQMYIKDEAARAELLGIYTTVRPGTRRIRLDHPALKADRAEAA